MSDKHVDRKEHLRDSKANSWTTQGGRTNEQVLWRFQVARWRRRWHMPGIPAMISEAAVLYEHKRRSVGARAQNAVKFSQICARKQSLN